MDKVYDIQKAIVMENEVALALLDTKYKAVMIIKPAISKYKDGEDVKLEIIEPDGEERLDWLFRLGIITAAEFEEEASKLEKTQKQRLINILQKSLK